MAATNASSGTREESNNRRSHQSTTIDRILECAVALNWNALAKTNEAIALQVEYRIGSGGSLDYLKLWASTIGGAWKLVCEYWMQSSSEHESGTTFNGGKLPGDFTWMLDAIMQHRQAFLPGSRDFVNGLVQINRPTDADLASAQADMNDALDRVGSHLARPLPPKG